MIKAVDQMYFGGLLAADSKLMMEGGLVTRFPPGRLQSPPVLQQQRLVLEHALKRAKRAVADATADAENDDEEANF